MTIVDLALCAVLFFCVCTRWTYVTSEYEKNKKVKHMVSCHTEPTTFDSFRSTKKCCTWYMAIIILLGCWLFYFFLRLMSTSIYVFSTFSTIRSFSPKWNTLGTRRHIQQQKLRYNALSSLSYKVYSLE